MQQTQCSSGLTAAHVQAQSDVPFRLPPQQGGDMPGPTPSLPGPPAGRYAPSFCAVQLAPQMGHTLHAEPEALPCGSAVNCTVAGLGDW